MTAPTLSPQPTTAVLGGLPFATVRNIVETMQRAFPDEYARIGRGLSVLLGSKIVATPTVGRYLVQSCTEGLFFYEATSLQCGCPDHQRHPEQRCKHSWALDILSVASAIASRERAEAATAAPSGQDADVLDLDPDAPIPFELTPHALAALAATAPPVPAVAQQSLSGEAACPHCGRVRGVVRDGEPVRCFGCHRHWQPEPAPFVA
jgi:hypothetical protein